MRKEEFIVEGGVECGRGGECGREKLSVERGGLSAEGEFSAEGGVKCGRGGGELECRMEECERGEISAKGGKLSVEGGS